MNNSNLKIDIREIVKDFNQKLIESNPNASYLQREYRVNGYKEDVANGKGNLEMKFEVKEDNTEIHSVINSFEDRFRIQMIRIPLN